MKRKIFSKLLMVALVIAAVGSFVSCKDYDDDINNLQKQIDNAALKSDLAALQTTLTSVQSTASKAATDATSALTKAGANADDIAALKTKANELGTQIATAAADATKGVADAKAASDAAAAAQATADAAKTAAQEAKDAVAPAIEAAVKEAQEKFNAAISAKADTAKVNELAAQLAEAEKTIGASSVLIAANSAAIKALEKTVSDNYDALDARIKALEAKGEGEGTIEAMGWAKAVTSIELVYAANQVNKGNLYFFQGEQALDYTFGKESTEVPASEYQEYKAGDDIIFRNNVIVRVNPVNATLKAEDVKLMNSLGESLDEIVKIQKVEKYNDLLTRAGETGLWQITFARQEKATDAQFAKTTKGSSITEDNKTARGKALYAIAVNNTEDNADRFAVTSYNFNIWYGEYEHANSLYFTVEGNYWGNLHNRWNGSKVVAEDDTKAQEPADYKWNAKGPAALPVVKSGSNANVTSDSRYTNKTYINAEVNEPFKIAGIRENFIDYYYVVLDYDCAIESAPSELRAWQSYVIEGINTKVESGKDLNITITDKGADAEGDIIGFRVFGVNYDGTLADPDGVAFYVQVGSAKEWEPVVKGASTEFTPTNASLVPFGGTAYAANNANLNAKINLAIFDCNFSDFGLAKDITLTNAGFPTSVTIPAGGANFSSVANPTSAAIMYLTGNTPNGRGEWPVATKVSDVKYVAFVVDAPEEIMDGAEFVTSVYSIKNPDDHGKKVGELQFKLKKGAVKTSNTDYDTNAFAWLNDYQPEGGVVTLYPSPATGWTNPGGWAAGSVVAGTAWLNVNLNDFSKNLWTTSPTAGEHYINFTHTYGDWYDWVQIPATEVNPSTILGSTLRTRVAETSRNAGYYHAQDFEGSIFQVQNYMLGTKSARDEKSHVVSMYIQAEGNGPAISRVWDDSHPNYDAATESHITTPDYAVVNQTLAFDDVMKYESYSTNLSYIDNSGNTSAAYDATKDVTKANFLWVSWAKLTGPSNIHVYYADRTTGAPWTKAAGAQWTAATAKAGAADMLNKAENTAVKSFGPSAFDPDYYVALTASDMVVISPNGAEDEYVSVVPGSTITNILLNKATGTMPKANMNMKLRLKCTDVLGNKMNVDIPFVLNVTE